MINKPVANFKRTDPSIPLTDPRFVWYPPAATDVQRTWRKAGWKAPSEQRQQVAA